MSNCLVIFGETQSGKTYTARILQRIFKTKTIYFDFVISAICESIRNFFEKKEFDDQETLWYKKIFDSEKDFGNFINDLKDIIYSNVEFFEKLYNKSIKGKRSASSFRSDIDSPSDVINLGLLGVSLNPIGSDIIDLVFKYIVKKSDFIVIEGIYFSSGTNYIKQLSSFCNKIVYLQTFYDHDKKIANYEYNMKKIHSIKEIVGNLMDDLFFKKSESKTQNQQKIIKKEIRKYQIFEKGQIGDSPSFEKIKKLHIPDNLKGKYVLDIGCNEGFFCFECEKRGAQAVGIEFNKTWHNLALKKKRELSSNAQFLLMDWNNIHTLNNKFDLILFLASFHYLKDNQLEMLKKIFDQMNPKGLLILELGLSDKNEETFYIDKIQRPGGDFCQYPNKFSLEKLLKDTGFKEVFFQGDGFNIKGDPIPRYVVHAIK